MIRNERFRADGDLAFAKIGDGLYRAMIDNEAIYIQGTPTPIANHNLAWVLVYPARDEVIDGYETKSEAVADAILFALLEDAA